MPGSIETLVDENNLLKFKGGDGLYRPFMTGEYTPTVSGGTNIDTCTGNVCGYLSGGERCMVFGSLNIDPTAVSIATTVKFSLPIASVLTLSTDLVGVCNSIEVAGLSGGIQADTQGNEAEISFINGSSILSTVWTFMMSYKLRDA